MSYFGFDLTLTAASLSPLPITVIVIKNVSSWVVVLTGGVRSSGLAHQICVCSFHLFPYRFWLVKRRKREDVKRPRVPLIQELSYLRTYPPPVTSLDGIEK